MTRTEIVSHARDYHRFLVALRDDRIDLPAVRRMRRINFDLNAVITASAGRDCCTDRSSSSRRSSIFPRPW